MKRTLQPELFEWINKRVATDNLAVHAVEARDPRALLIRVAHACIGVREEGDNSGHVVELFQRTIGRAEKESWCMSFVQSCIAYVEQKLGVMSPVIASEHCLTVWQETPASQRVQNVPKEGAICIWQHGKTSQGHTGITATPVANHLFHSYEGNTTGGVMPGGEIVREGGGSYETVRSLDGAGDMHIVGFLKPFITA